MAQVMQETRNIKLVAYLRLQKIFPDKVISVDGRFSLDHLSLFKNIGLDAICVGSRIFLGGVPEEDYVKSIKRVKGLEGEGSL